MHGHHHSLCAKWKKPNQARRGPWSKPRLNPPFLQHPSAGANRKQAEETVPLTPPGLLPFRKVTGAGYVSSGVRKTETRDGGRDHGVRCSVGSHVRRPIAEAQLCAPTSSWPQRRPSRSPLGPSRNLLPRLPVSFPFLLRFRLFLKLKQINKTSRV